MIEFRPLELALLTAGEAAAYLRLTDDGRDAGAALKSLNRLVDKGLIRPCMYMYQKERLYSRLELDRFIERQTARALRDVDLSAAGSTGKATPSDGHGGRLDNHQGSAHHATQHQPAYFPGTSEPIPPLLTPSETVRVLRLDVLTTANGSEKPRTLPDALKSLDHLVRTGRLSPLRLSKSRTFARGDVLGLINRDKRPD